MISQKNRPSLDSLSGASPAAHVPMPRYAWGTRVLLPAGIVVVLLLLLLYTGRDALLPATPVSVVPAVARESAESSGSALVQAAGWVEPEPYAVSVSALADGIVRDLLVLEGERVTRGQVVARLVDEEAALALAHAEAELSIRHAELAAARETWENPVERTRAREQAAALVAETQAQRIQLDAEIAAETARTQELTEQAQRIEVVHRANAASEQEASSSRLRMQAQQAVLQATQARAAVLDAQLQARRAELAAAERHERLRTEERRSLASAEAAVALATASRDAARLQLQRMEVRSQVDGVVMTRLVQPGSKLTRGGDDPNSATVVRLFDPEKLQVRVDVPVAEAAKIGVDLPATIVVGVLPDKRFNGRVTRIVHEADVAKNTLQVKVQIDNPTPELKPEMLARVRFQAPEQASGRTAMTVFVPESLLVNSGGRTVVWIADRTTGRAALREVQAGDTKLDGWTSVRSGVQAGDLLIENAAGLSDGQRIRIGKGQ